MGSLDDRIFTVHDVFVSVVSAASLLWYGSWFTTNGNGKAGLILLFVVFRFCRERSEDKWASPAVGRYDKVTY